MQIDNGERRELVIAGVFDGMAGVTGQFLSFVPNRYTADPRRVLGGTLDGMPVLLSPRKDADGPFWTARYEAIAP